MFGATTILQKRFSGKVAIVTGGTSGIGAACVERFINEGAKVAIVGRSEKSGAAMLERFGDIARFIKADVSEESEVARIVTETVKWGGRLDVMVNNAGGRAPGGVDTFSGEDFEFAIKLVLGSVLYGIKYAAQAMKPHGSGAIINNSSIGALRTHMGDYLYSIAKAGVTHATKLAGMELGRFGITVNSISPGAIMTPLFLGGSRAFAYMKPEKAEMMTAKVVESLSQATPVGHPGYPADAAAAVAFLASDEGHYINCHDLVLDGGLTAAGRGSFHTSSQLDSPIGTARISLSGNEAFRNEMGERSAIDRTAIRPYR